MTRERSRERGRGRPLVDRVISDLQGLLESDDLQRGDKLPTEAQLTERFGVGRSTLREAIRVLSHNGVLETRQGSGTYVLDSAGGRLLSARLAAAHVPEVFEVRRALEVLVAQLAPLRRSAADVDAMREALAECRRHAANGDIAAFVSADARFHERAVESCRNSVLVTTYESLRESLDPALQIVADVADLERANDRHEVLIDAIARADPAAAVAATLAHLDETITLFPDGARAGDALPGSPSAPPR